MGFRHLNYLQRCQILALWKAEFNQTQIAKEVGVHKSTICRELKRNITFVRTALGYWTYKPDYAQNYAKERRQKSIYWLQPRLAKGCRGVLGNSVPSCKEPQEVLAVIILILIFH